MQNPEEGELQPWTAEQAKVWRASQRTNSPWRIVWLQIVVAVVLTILTLIIGGQKSQAMSVAYGGFCVIFPLAMFMRGVRMGKGTIAISNGLVIFAVWELAKVVLTIALLVLAPKLITELNWLALLAGFVVTMKAYWVALWLLPVRNKSVLVH